MLLSQSSSRYHLSSCILDLMMLDSLMLWMKKYRVKKKIYIPFNLWTVLLLWRLLQSFHTPKVCYLWLISLCAKNCITYQIFIGIIPTFSENFIQFNQVWPQLQLQTWSEAILRIYTSLDHFIIDSLQNGFWRLPLIDRKFWEQFHLSINFGFPVYQW